MELLPPEKGYSIQMEKTHVRMEMGHLLNETGAYQILLRHLSNVKRGEAHIKKKRGTYPKEIWYLLEKKRGTCQNKRGTYKR